MSIIDRLTRSARKQKEFRHIVRGGLRTPYTDRQRKRMADMYFLRHYAGWSYAKLAQYFKVSPQRAAQIVSYRSLTKGMLFTICHPKRSCM